MRFMCFMRFMCYAALCSYAFQWSCSRHQQTTVFDVFEGLELFSVEHFMLKPGTSATFCGVVRFFRVPGEDPDGAGSVTGEEAGWLDGEVDQIVLQNTETAYDIQLTSTNMINILD